MDLEDLELTDFFQGLNTTSEELDQGALGLSEKRLGGNKGSGTWLVWRPPDELPPVSSGTDVELSVVPVPPSGPAPGEPRSGPRSGSSPGSNVVLRPA